MVGKDNVAQLTHNISEHAMQSTDVWKAILQ